MAFRREVSLNGTPSAPSGMFQKVCCLSNRSPIRPAVPIVLYIVIQVSQTIGDLVFV